MEKVKVSAKISQALTIIIAQSGDDINLRFSKLGKILYRPTKHTYKKYDPLLQVKNHQALFNALQYGFEIEEIYNLQDQIVRLDGEPFITGKKIERVHRVGEFYLTYNFDKGVKLNEVRHATEQDIENEKWTEIGRAPADLELGDICLLKDRIVRIHSDSDITEMRTAYAEGKFIGICPTDAVLLFDSNKTVLPPSDSKYAIELLKYSNKLTHRKIASHEREIQSAEFDLKRTTDQTERMQLIHYIDEQREQLNELKRSLITEVSSDYE